MSPASDDAVGGVADHFHFRYGCPAEIQESRDTRFAWRPSGDRRASSSMTDPESESPTTTVTRATRLVRLVELVATTLAALVTVATVLGWL